MRSLCLNLFVAVGLVFTLTSQAFAGNWIFEESTDSSDGRKGVIIYKSDHFDTTPGTFARFIVLDNNTLRLRIRTTATGTMFKRLEVYFTIPVGEELDLAWIYKPDEDASRCAAEQELATACRLSCARTYEDFSQGDEVACTAKSDDNLWTDFRADFMPEHTDRILQDYPKLDRIGFYAGENDADKNDHTLWYLNADDLLKVICQQTKPLDHACRGGEQTETALKLPDEYTREEVCAVLRCEDKAEDSAATQKPELEVTNWDDLPPCVIDTEEFGSLSVFASDEDGRVQIDSHEQRNGKSRSRFAVIYENIDKPLIQLYIFFDRSDEEELYSGAHKIENGGRAKIVFSGAKKTWSVKFIVGYEAFHIESDNLEQLEGFISDLDKEGDVKIAVSSLDNDVVVFKSTYSMRGLSKALPQAKSRHASLRTDLSNDVCMAWDDWNDW